MGSHFLADHGFLAAGRIILLMSHGPAGVTDGVEICRAQIGIAQRSAHVPYIHLSRRFVLPYQVGVPVVIEVGQTHHFPTDMADAVEVRGVQIATAEWSAHVPCVHLTRGIVLPHQVGVPVAVEVGYPCEGPPGVPDGIEIYAAEEGSAERSTHVPHEHLTSAVVLPYQIRHAVAVKIARHSE